MTRKEKIFEIAKAIAPIFAKEGAELCKRIADNGTNPATCSINGKDILHAYGESVKEWATAFVDELEKEEQSK